MQERLQVCKYLYCIVLYCIVSIHLYSASCSAHKSEELSMRETQRKENSLERTKRGNVNVYMYVRMHKGRHVFVYVCI